MPFPTDLRHFVASEFVSPDKMDPWFLRILDQIRYMAGVPMIVTSSYRDDPGSAHSFGLAVDISDNKHGLQLGPRWRFKVLRAAFALGITRIGIYDRHIHLDISQDFDQEVVWYGESI